MKLAKPQDDDLSVDPPITVPSAQPSTMTTAVSEVIWDDFGEVESIEEVQTDLDQGAESNNEEVQVGKDEEILVGSEEEILVGSYEEIFVGSDEEILVGEVDVEEEECVCDYMMNDGEENQGVDLDEYENLSEE